MKKVKLIFDGTPNKLMPHRVPFDKRPMTGETWQSGSYSFLEGAIVEITSVDPFGCWYNYEWVDDDGELIEGTIGQNQLEMFGGDAYKIEFAEEVNKKELQELINKLEL